MGRAVRMCTGAPATGLACPNTAWVLMYVVGRPSDGASGRVTEYVCGRHYRPVTVELLKTGKSLMVREIKGE